MVIIHLLELTDEKVVYGYFPNGEKNGGKVAFSRKSKEKKILEKADGYPNTYAFHALKRIEEYDTIGEYKEKDMIAWY